MERFCLKSGFIMDGTGEKGYLGDVLVENGRIKCVSKTSLEVDCPVIDCTGLTISPGFIDSHSHMDRFIFYKNDVELTDPPIHQGITTYVAGNCGMSIAGIAEGSPYRDDICRAYLKNNYGKEEIAWNSYAEYFDFLRKKGIRQNLAMMAGHGTALHSLVGDRPSEPTSPETLKKVKAILAEGLDAGCKGISFGLGYRPGVFIPDSEVRQVSDVSIERNKLITVHSRVLGNRAVDVYGTDFSEPHNIRWHREFLNLFRGSNARLEISHLLFVGRQAWPYYDDMMSLIQDSIDNGGIDLWFDMYSYIQGPTSIAIMLPQVFYQNLPQIYTDKALIRKLDEALEQKAQDRGILASDVMLCNPMDPELEQYKGMFMDEICKARGMTLAELYMDLYRRTNGFAVVYLMIEQPEENVPKQMVHPRALYMTDAWVEPGCQQNPSVYGSMPKFLRLCRETGNQTMEQTIAHMTGNAAKRFDLFGRGFIREGYAADIVVFDSNTVAEAATPQDPEHYALGIHYVFINGVAMLSEGKVNTTAAPGMVL